MFTIGILATKLLSFRSKRPYNQQKQLLWERRLSLWMSKRLYWLWIPKQLFWPPRCPFQFELHSHKNAINEIIVIGMTRWGQGLLSLRTDQASTCRSLVKVLLDLQEKTNLVQQRILSYIEGLYVHTRISRCQQSLRQFSLSDMGVKILAIINQGKAAPGRPFVHLFIQSSVYPIIRWSSYLKLRCRQAAFPVDIDWEDVWVWCLDVSKMMWYSWSACFVYFAGG